MTIDQSRADYLDRFGPQMTGGIARMMRDGARFTDAHQDHAITETAPGHATLLSGRFPRSTGILRNTAGVEDPQSPLVTSKDPPASPYRFRGSVLIDWLRTRGFHQFGCIGESQGGATIALAAAELHEVKWVVLESVYPTLHNAVDRRFRELPGHLAEQPGPVADPPVQRHPVHAELGSDALHVDALTGQESPAGQPERRLRSGVRDRPQLR